MTGEALAGQDRPNVSGEIDGLRSGRVGAEGGDGEEEEAGDGAAEHGSDLSSTARQERYRQEKKRRSLCMSSRLPGSEGIVNDWKRSARAGKKLANPVDRE